MKTQLGRRNLGLETQNSNPHETASRRIPAALARVVALTTVALAGLTARTDVAVEPLLRLAEDFNDVAYTPDDQCVLSSVPYGLLGTRVVLWDLRTGQKVRELEGGTGPVAVSANGQWALTGSEADIAKLWDLGDLMDWLGEQWHVPDVVVQPLHSFGYGNPRVGPA